MIFKYIVCEVETRYIVYYSTHNYLLIKHACIHSQNQSNMHLVEPIKTLKIVSELLKMFCVRTLCVCKREYGHIYA